MFPNKIAGGKSKTGTNVIYFTILMEDICMSVISCKKAAPKFLYCFISLHCQILQY